MSDESTPIDIGVSTQPIVETTVVDAPVEAGEQAEVEPPQRVDDLLGWQKALITKERNAAREARERAERAEMYADTLARQQQALRPQPEAPKEPRREAYEEGANGDAQFVRDAIQWQVKTGVAQQLAEHEQQRQKQEAAARFNDSVRTARTRYEDFDDVVVGSRIRLNDDVTEAIADSPVAAEVLYWLAKNPDHAQNISGLPKVAAARVIGRVEAMLIAQGNGQQQQPSKPAIAQAPKPVTPVGALNPVQKDPYRMTAEEFYQWDMQQSKAKRAQQRR